MSFPDTGQIWMNGQFVAWNAATIHVASHAVHYGSAVFEGARCYDTPNGTVCFRLDAHLRRLQQSGRIYRMEYPLDLSGWTDAVLETIRANRLRACYIRPLIYRGYGSLGVTPAENPVDAAILAWEWGTYGGQDALEIVASTCRPAPGRESRRIRCLQWPSPLPTTPTRPWRGCRPSSTGLSKGSCSMRRATSVKARRRTSSS